MVRIDYGNKPPPDTHSLTCKVISSSYYMLAGASAHGSHSTSRALDKIPFWAFLVDMPEQKSTLAGCTCAINASTWNVTFAKDPMARMSHMTLPNHKGAEVAILLCAHKG